MSDPIYSIGDKNVIGRTWTYLDGTPVDPDFASITVREPDGLLTKFLKADMTNPTIGTWLITWTFRKSGRHVFTFETAGNVGKTDEYFVQVRRRQGYPVGQAVIATSS